MFKKVKTNNVKISKEYVLEESSFSKRINLFEKNMRITSTLCERWKVEILVLEFA